MREIQVAAAQFEARDGDKSYNLDVVGRLARSAADGGAGLVAFHECSVSGYTFLENLSRDELAALAEPVPGGPSVKRLVSLAASLGIAIGAGLV
jgi:predicted amidohydrolase